MFDVGFSELVVIGIVALVVIGPERLPKVARTAGLLLGRMRRYVDDIKADIDREMQLDELKKLKADMQDTARNFEMNVLGEMQEIEKAVGQQAQSVRAALEDLPATAVESAVPEIPEADAQPADAPISSESPGRPSGETPQPVAKA